MKNLCIDTSSSLCSVSIFEDYKLINKVELNNSLTHSETLMPLIQKILKDSSLSLNEINLIIVDIGPGSFTGIRIGIATAKAFSDSLGIPCVGVSSLEVLAYNAKEDGIICSSIDCKNDNSYFAIYSKRNDEIKLLVEPQCMSNSEIENMLNLKFSNTNIQFIGNGIYSNDLVGFLKIENLGIAGLKKYKDESSNKDELLPLYIKKPQAQILMERKEKGL